MPREGPAVVQGPDDGLPGLLQVPEQEPSVDVIAMDIMEMDIRRTPGNSRFRLDGCFDVYRAELSVTSRFGYSCEMTRRYGFY